MKKEKKLNMLYRVLGFISGGMVGIFVGYQMGELFTDTIYDDFSELSFFLSLVVGSLGCVTGFLLTEVLISRQHHN